MLAVRMLMLLLLLLLLLAGILLRLLLLRLEFAGWCPCVRCLFCW